MCLNYSELPQLQQMRRGCWQGLPQRGGGNGKEELSERTQRITSNFSLYSVPLNVKVLWRGLVVPERVNRRSNKCGARKPQDFLLFNKRFSLPSLWIGFVSPSRTYFVLRKILQKLLVKFASVSLNLFWTHLIHKSMSEDVLEPCYSWSCPQEALSCVQTRLPELQRRYHLHPDMGLWNNTWATYIAHPVGTDQEICDKIVFTREIKFLMENSKMPKKKVVFLVSSTAP